MTVSRRCRGVYRRKDLPSGPRLSTTFDVMSESEYGVRYDGAAVCRVVVSSFGRRSVIDVVVFRWFGFLEPLVSASFTLRVRPTSFL